MAGILYNVATPIGNLEDITLRALRILKEVDLIAAEDTRHTKKLLTHYGIQKPLTSYHEHNEKNKSSQLIHRLKEGCLVALVSDAGTPLLSDPGFRLVQEAIRAEVQVVPIPGPSALTAVLSVSGLPMDSFAFEGFLTAKKAARRQKLAGLHEEERTLVFFEVPHRVQESLRDILEILGDREIVLGREVTKMHEEFLRGSVSQLISDTGPRKWRGEITVVVGGGKKDRDRDRDTKKDSDRDREIRAEIHRLRAEGMRVKEIAEILGERFSMSKREVYSLALERTAES